MHKNDFIKLFREAFPAKTEWTEWFMSFVFNENDMHWIEKEGKLVSTLLLSPYPFIYHGATLKCGYVSCVSTAKNERGKGYMNSLMRSVIATSAESGYAFISLIPANRRLFFFYDEFGFSTVFYIDEQRYTSLHSFASDPGFFDVEPDYAMFHRLEGLRECGVQHDESRFRHIVDDNRLDGGIIVAVSDGEGDEAMAFVQNESEAKIVDLLSSSDRASEAVLASVRKHIGEKTIIIMAEPPQVESVDSPRGARLRSRAMLRIADAQPVLNALAAADPTLSRTIRLRDSIVTRNNAIFRLGSGHCERLNQKPQHIDLDVTTEVLAKILFSAPGIGNIFGLPTQRPFMSLMLD